MDTADTSGDASGKPGKLNDPGETQPSPETTPGGTPEPPPTPEPDDDDEKPIRLIRQKNSRLHMLRETNEDFTRIALVTPILIEENRNTPIQVYSCLESTDRELEEPMLIYHDKEGYRIINKIITEEGVTD